MPLVIIQTHSGGPGAAAADACSRANLVLPQLSEKTLAGLVPLVPHTGSFNNPVDLTFSKNPMDFFAAIPDVLLSESGADGMLVYFLSPVQIVRRNMESLGVSECEMPELIDKLYSDQAVSMADLTEKHHKPLIGFTFQSLENSFIEKLLDHGMAVLPSPERAARAMAALVRYSRIVSRPAT